MQAALEDVFVSEALERYIVALAQATRTDPRVTLGASPRGSLALLKLARAEAAIRGRDFVLPDDVKAVAVAALAHRLVLRPELWVSSTTPAPGGGGRAPAGARAGRRARVTWRPTALNISFLTVVGWALFLGRAHGPRRARGGRGARWSWPSWPAGAPGAPPTWRIHRELSTARLLEDECVTVTVTLRRGGAAAPRGAARAAAAAGRARARATAMRSSRSGPARRFAGPSSCAASVASTCASGSARAGVGTARARRRRGPASRARDGGGLPAACADQVPAAPACARRRSWATTSRPRREKASSPATSGPSRPAIRSGT